MGAASLQVLIAETIFRLDFVLTGSYGRNQSCASDSAPRRAWTEKGRSESHDGVKFVAKRTITSL